MSNDFHTLYPSVRYDKNMRQESVEWLVKGLWQKGKINAMAGFEKGGKSRVMNYILAGLPKEGVLGLQCPNEEPKVLYLCGEEPIAVVNGRLARYAKLQGLDEHEYDMDFIEAAAMRLDLKQQRNELLTRLVDTDRNMLVIDPWRRVHGADENDSSAMAPMYNDLRKWSNSYGITILVVHHTPKLSEDTDMNRIASWFRGSTDLPAILDTAQYVHRTGKALNILRQGRFPPLPPLQIFDLGGTGLNDDKGFSLSKPTETKAK